MIRFKNAVAGMLVLVLGGIFVKPAGQSPFRSSDQQLEQLAVRLEKNSNSFRLSIKEAIALSFLNDAQIGNYMKNYAHEFTELTIRLNKRLKERKPISSETQEVLNRAEYIDSFMSRYELDPQAEEDWQRLRADLDQLASHYKIVTHWNTPEYLGVPQPTRVEALENRLVGTYELDKSRSTDVRKTIERALNGMPLSSRVRMQITLMQRLRAPKLLAIERDRSKVTFGSSLQDARIYEIVERAQTDQNERVATLLYGGQFRINTGSDSDGLYSVTFGSTNLGSRLEVIKIALLNQFKIPIVVTHYYTKISDAAIFDLSEEEETVRSPLGRNGAQKKN
jgi:hypothetical protein